MKTFFLVIFFFLSRALYSQSRETLNKIVDNLNSKNYKKALSIALEEGLENFAGCAVIISHDRWFLNRVATHILEFEGDSKVVWFEGGYTDYEENFRKRVNDTTPKRIKFKKLIA